MGTHTHARKDVRMHICIIMHAHLHDVYVRMHARTRTHMYARTHTHTGPVAGEMYGARVPRPSLTVRMTSLRERT